jgi:membrane protease YdiL (CAAX protease family)
MNHTQYDWSGRFCIFVSGLALGYFRWHSNSTWLTVMVHSATNIVSFFLVGPYV